MTTPGYRQRPGDQPLPVVGTGPPMHDLVIADLSGREEPEDVKDMVEALLLARARTGLERYGQPLRAGNGRDAVRDLLEELADAAVYARLVREDDAQRTGWADTAYQLVLDTLFVIFGYDEDTAAIQASGLVNSCRDVAGQTGLTPRTRQ